MAAVLGLSTAKVTVVNNAPKSSTDKAGLRLHLEDCCCICLEKVPIDLTKYFRQTCCGKGIHIHCYNEIMRSGMSKEQKSNCPHCREFDWPEDSPEDVLRLQKWSDKGKAWAQTLLGTCYRQGTGIEQSHSKAFDLYKMAAEQDDPNAMVCLGLMYRNGYGVEHSLEAANGWWKKAELYGIANATRNINWANPMGSAVHVSSFVGSTTESVLCSSCGTPETTEHKLKACKGCHTTQYCNRKCQMQHWGVGKHRAECKKESEVSTRSTKFTTPAAAGAANGEGVRSRWPVVIWNAIVSTTRRRVVALVVLALVVYLMPYVVLAGLVATVVLWMGVV